MGNFFSTKWSFYPHLFSIRLQLTENQIDMRICLNQIFVDNYFE